MAQELGSLSSVQTVDDLYFSALSNEHEDEVFPISDSLYAEELQLQEALMSSVIASQTLTPNPPLTIQFQVTPVSVPETVVVGAKESGQSSHRFCEICAEKKDAEEMFRIDSCAHSFCSACISQHIAVKLGENALVVPCPAWECDGVLELDDCRPRVSTEMVARWDELLCESVIPASEKFYCPFSDCSAMLVNDEGSLIRQSECPICHRLFCAQCYVPWHGEIACEEFQGLNEDERGREDLMVRELAKSESWKRCPHCKYYVEKTEGCLHMTCRCRFQFCYACGETWSDTHGAECRRP
ncbi:E3 ubiquitin-protein ligase RSL1-like [Diospyros lotus]|uniref:E3 ubiquitin-protein ligase RSL1-like n=1 Tax=Diospyros lotus TaxID=55363 RepID=UPI00224DAD7E|nr:E3 ubiquitin-protein ligase RSL1-like [Diospyros lotus]